MYTTNSAVSGCLCGPVVSCIVFHACCLIMWPSGLMHSVSCLLPYACQMCVHLSLSLAVCVCVCVCVCVPHRQGTRDFSLTQMVAHSLESWVQTLNSVERYNTYIHNDYPLCKIHANASCSAKCLLCVMLGLFVCVCPYLL